MITVLVPAYDVGALLERSVASALAQDVALEVLVVDDGSTDDTLQVAQRLAARDARVRVLSLPENGGPAKARNAGLTEARGEWVALLDADDAFVPGRLRVLLETAEATEADFIADGILFYDAATDTAQEAVMRPAPEVEVLDAHEFVARARPFTPEVDYGLLKPLVRMRFVQQTGLRYPEDLRYGEDFVFVLEALLRGARYCVVRRPGYLYTTRASGWSRTPLEGDSQTEATLALRRRPDVAADRRLAALLRRRALASRRLAAQRLVARVAAERDVRGYLRSAKDPFVHLEALRYVKRRVTR